MGFCITSPHRKLRKQAHEPRQERRDPPSENRVWDFQTASRFRAPHFSSQPTETTSETTVTVTITVSGLSFWPSRDPIGTFGGLNEYGVVGNEPIGRWDLLGLEWTVDRSSLGYAIARTLTPDEDSLYDLAVDISLSRGEILEWARKDALGTRFASREEAESSCGIYVPNTILLFLAALPKSDLDDDPSSAWGPWNVVNNYRWVRHVVAYNAMAHARNKMSELAWIYDDKGFSLKVHDFNITPSFPKVEEFEWPVYGLFSISHGAPYISGGIVPTSVAGGLHYAGPMNLVYPNDMKGEYGYGVLFVHACYAGFQAWDLLAALNAADVYVAHPSLNFSSTFPHTVKLPQK